MPFLHDDLLDAALDVLDTDVETLYICSAEPSDYTEASSTYKLGTKSSPSVGAAEDGDASGRKVTVAAINDGTVDSNGTASHWALTDNSLTKLLAAGPLASSQSVTSGNTFTLTAFDIEIADPTT